MQTVLPPNSTQLEKDLVTAVMQELESLLTGVDGDLVIRDLWNPDKCPAAFLPYLACAYSVDSHILAFPEARVRALIRKSVELHKIKGTHKAVRDLLEILGYSVSGSNWLVTGTAALPQAEQNRLDAWACYKITVTNPVSIAIGEALEKLIAGYAPMTRELVEVTYTSHLSYNGVDPATPLVQKSLKYDKTYSYGGVDPRSP